MTKSIHILESIIFSIILTCLSDRPAFAVDSFVLEADDDHQWYRGNMHTHSLWSDGDDYLDNIALWYRENGYQFLVFTDHNVLPNTERWIDVEASKGGLAALEKLKSQFSEFVQERASAEGKLEVRLNTFQEVASRLDIPGKFLLIQGEEISDKFEDAPIHINASNIQEFIPPMQGGSVAETIQNNIRAVLSQREKTGVPMVVHVNHPNFGYALTAEDMMLIRGEQFFEVYNGHPHVNDQGDPLHASCDRIWDILLTGRIGEFQLPVLYGLATDDSHDHHQLGENKSNPGRGWVMVLAPDLSIETLIDSLEAGQFYASSGVNLRRIAISPQEYSVEIEPNNGEEYLIEFIGTRKGYDWTSKPVIDEEGKEIRTTHRYSDDIGKTLATARGTQARYKFLGDELYVRARVTSSAKAANASMEDGPMQAWCQPVVLSQE